MARCPNEPNGMCRGGPSRFQIYTPVTNGGIALRRISASIFGGEKGKGASSNVLAKNSATIDLRGIVAAWLANVHY